MKRERYMYGVRGEQYGIWNTAKRCWQFGICEDTPMLAEARLFQKIGDSARKWRFEVRVLPVEMRRAKPEPLLLAELQRKDRELKELKHSMRHGHWHWFENENGTPLSGYDRDWGWECSVCRTALPDDYDNPDEAPKIAFCPYCGAKMDEEAG